VVAADAVGHQQPKEIRTDVMTNRALTIALLFGCPALFAQRPTNPALMEPQVAPALDYVAVADPLPLPEGSKMGAPASVAYDSRGNLFVLYRGAQAMAEFDPNGKFVRAFGDGFRRTHGLTIDRDDNFWVTDVGSHIVVKLDKQGNTLLTIGTKGEAGEWNEATQSHHLNEPNEVAIGPNGDVFVVQGHTPGKGDPRVLKFDKNGNFKKSWGGLGTEPGKFNVAHGIAFDAKGLMWVADRENERIQIFDDEGKFVREIKYAGLPCGMKIGGQYIYMVNGFAGQLLRLDLNGNVLGVVGKSGKGVGEFGEAHYVAVSPKGEVFVADTVNSAVQKFVKK
jgi:DNA-binding beta-propeller fold protein YncE